MQIYGRIRQAIVPNRLKKIVRKQNKNGLMNKLDV